MTKKRFDCVQMKNDIQAQLLKEYEGLSLQERHERFEKAIEADPDLARIWRNARRTPASAAPPDSKD